MGDFMSENSCSTRTKIIFIVLTIGFIAFAFVHSAMSADISGEESGGITAFLQNIIDRLNLNIELNDYIVRKTAHFTEYFAIGFSIFMTAFSFNNSKPYRYITHILFCGLFTAVIDETIQLFTDGRAGQVADVLLDFSGCVTGITITFIALKIFSGIYKKHNPTPQKKV